ncbi:MAG: NADH-quinone oxidoreductase subunit C [Methanobacteriota archaeon]|nr:MAG: NADH-quinone oxidoreductase subunit C [Euryarchaeota archaeon]
MPEVSGTEEDVMSKLPAEFPGAIREIRVTRPKVVKVVIDRKDLLPVCSFLKTDLGFEHLSCISAVDWKDHWESVYHLYNYTTGTTVQLNAVIPYDDPSIESLVKLWNAAYYHEREAWDLMGITYRGNPKLERILLPKDFRYHPLRKDFPQETERQYISRRKLKTGGR